MKRIIYQCDKCLKTKEQPDLPGDWTEVSTRDALSIKLNEGKVIKTWCALCWKEISQPYPQPAESK